jgi:hypothetical protein
VLNQNYRNDVTLTTKFPLLNAMANRKIHKSTVCRRYVGQHKKLIVACRSCRLNENCTKFRLYLYPDLAFKNIYSVRENPFHQPWPINLSYFA